MKILDHLGQAAAILLLIELLVVLIIFLAISGGLAWGLRWVNGKSSWAYDKANSYLPLMKKYLRMGTDYIALPFIKANALAEMVKQSGASIERRIRSSHSSPPGNSTSSSAGAAGHLTEEQSIEPILTV